jgi:hypothetical protein
VNAAHAKGHEPVSHLSGEHSPVGQDIVAAELPACGLKAEKILFMDWLPHFSHRCLSALSAFSRNSVTWQHFLHLYSNMGIDVPPGIISAILNIIALDGKKSSVCLSTCQMDKLSTGHNIFR